MKAKYIITNVDSENDVVLPADSEVGCDLQTGSGEFGADSENPQASNIVRAVCLA